MQGYIKDGTLYCVDGHKFYDKRGKELTDFGIALKFKQEGNPLKEIVIPPDFDGVAEHYSFIEENDKIILTTLTAEALEKAEARLLSALRLKRQSECFAIINRGQLWYDTLNETQKAELSNWYRAWLDVTETKVEPTKPEWLDE